MIFWRISAKFCKNGSFRFLVEKYVLFYLNSDFFSEKQNNHSFSKQIKKHCYRGWSRSGAVAGLAHSFFVQGYASEQRWTSLFIMWRWKCITPKKSRKAYGSMKHWIVESSLDPTDRTSAISRDLAPPCNPNQFDGCARPKTIFWRRKMSQSTSPAGIG